MSRIRTAAVVLGLSAAAWSGAQAQVLAAKPAKAWVALTANQRACLAAVTDSVFTPEFELASHRWRLNLQTKTIRRTKQTKRGRIAFEIKLEDRVLTTTETVWRHTRRGLKRGAEKVIYYDANGMASAVNNRHHLAWTGKNRLPQRFQHAIALCAGELGERNLKPSPPLRRDKMVPGPVPAPAVEEADSVQLG